MKLAGLLRHGVKRRKLERAREVTARATFIAKSLAVLNSRCRRRGEHEKTLARVMAAGLHVRLDTRTNQFTLFERMEQA